MVLVYLFLCNLALDSCCYDYAQEVDEFSGISPIVVMYIHCVTVYDVLVEVEHRLDFPSLGIGQIDIKRVKVCLGLEHDKPKGRLLTAEESSQGYLILLKHWGEYSELACLLVLMVVGNRSTHRIHLNVHRDNRQLVIVER